MSVRKANGEELEPDTLSSKFNSIARHLRQIHYCEDPRTSKVFEHSRQVLAAKRKQLKAEGRGNHPNKASRMESDEISILKQKGQLGCGMLTLLFRIYKFESSVNCVII